MVGTPIMVLSGVTTLIPSPFNGIQVLASCDEIDLVLCIFNSIYICDFSAKIATDTTDTKTHTLFIAFELSSMYEPFFFRLT